MKKVLHITLFTRNTVKDEEKIKNAQRLSEYRQVDPELRRLHFEVNVKITMIRLLES